MTAFALAALLALAPVCRVWAAEGENAEQGTAASAEDAGAQTLEALMETFRAENGLDEGNFSISYYNPGSGERYSFGADRLMLAASTYKVPLNMYYYDLERAGELASDTLIQGYTLEACHEQSIVYSNNEISEAMIYAYPGSFFAYKNAMLELLGMEDAELAPDFYYDNYYSTGMMMAALERLYENADDYEELIGYMKETFPQKGYFRRYVTDCEVAHKYGSFEGAENDTGIIYAGQPFLLAVYTQDVAGEEICAKAARLMKDYTDEQYAIQLEQERLETERYERAERLEADRAAQEESQEGAEEREALRTEQREAVKARLLAAEAERLAAEKAPEESGGFRLHTRDYLLVAGGAVLIALLGYLGVHGLTRHVGRYEKRWKDKYDGMMRK